MHVQLGFIMETILAALTFRFRECFVISDFHDDGGNTLTEIGSNRFRGDALGSSYHTTYESGFGVQSALRSR
jgi:hypothetical protein